MKRAEEPEPSPATPPYERRSVENRPSGTSDVVGNPGLHGGLRHPGRGDNRHMQLRQVIQRRIRGSAEGVDLIGDVNAAISANVGERSSATHVSSHSTVSANSQEKEEGRDQGRRRTSG